VGYGAENTVLRAHASQAAQAQAAANAAAKANTNKKVADAGKTIANNVKARQSTPMPGGITK
jgi:hypothetical protein